MFKGEAKFQVGDEVALESYRPLTGRTYEGPLTVTRCTTRFILLSNDTKWSIDGRWSYPRGDRRDMVVVPFTADVRDEIELAYLRKISIRRAKQLVDELHKCHELQSMRDITHTLGRLLTTTQYVMPPESGTEEKA